MILSRLNLFSSADWVAGAGWLIEIGAVIDGFCGNAGVTPGVTELPELSAETLANCSNDIGLTSCTLAGASNFDNGTVVGTFTVGAFIVGGFIVGALA